MMGLYRRREAVTAVEILEYLRKYEAGDPVDHERRQIAIGRVEAALTAICNKNGIVENG